MRMARNEYFRLGDTVTIRRVFAFLHEMRSIVACLLLWANPVALLLLSARQPLVARPLRQPLFVRRTAPLLQEKMPKDEPSSKGELVPSEDDVATGETTRMLTAADEEVVGNLVEDEEWLGLGTEMFIVLRSSLRESLKKNTREFTGNDECAPQSQSNRTPLAALLTPAPRRAQTSSAT